MPGADKKKACDTTSNGVPFDRENLTKTVIAVPLLEKIAEQKSEKLNAKPIPIIIDINNRYPDGRLAARERIFKLIEDAFDASDGQQPGEPVDRPRVGPANNMSMPSSAEVSFNMSLRLTSATDVKAVAVEQWLRSLPYVTTRISSSMWISSRQVLMREFISGNTSRKT